MIQSIVPTVKTVHLALRVKWVNPERMAFPGRMDVPERTAPGVPWVLLALRVFKVPMETR